MKTPSYLKEAIPGITLVTYLLSLCALPFLAFFPSLPGVVAMFVFFVPQYVFPINTFAPEHQGRVSAFVWLLVWLCVSISFGFIFRKKNFRFAIFMAPVVIIAATVFIHFGIVLSGYKFELDGP